MLINILFEIAAFAALAVYNMIALKKIPVSPRVAEKGKNV